MNGIIEEKLEQERIEWAPTGKDDEKFQKKQAAKMQDKGPTNKAINSKLLEEENKQEDSSKKPVKNGWGKAK